MIYRHASRRTGKTEAMLEVATDAALEGNVVVVAASRAHVRELVGRLVSMGMRRVEADVLRSPAGKVVRVVAPSRVSRDPCSPRGVSMAGTNAATFVDHSVWEQGLIQ